MKLADLPDELNRLTYAINGAAIEVHRVLGPGLLERIYQQALAKELVLRGHDVETEVALPVEYKGESLGETRRIDILVDGTIVIEVKTVEEVHPVHLAQVRTYLRLTRKPLGLLYNFNVTLMRDGWDRVLP